MSEAGTEQAVAAKIQKLVQSLNGELEMAQEMGLKVTITGSSMFNFPPSGCCRVSIRIWKEQELLSVSAKELDRVSQ